MSRAGFLAVIAAILSGAISGCGYHLRSGGESSGVSNELAKKGIHTIYVDPIENNTYKPGVENLVYNSLLKRISSERDLKLIATRENADAILKGQVTEAAKAVTGQSRASELIPRGKGSEQILIATQYQAQLTCSFELVARESETKALWRASFTKLKPFPANNQIGTFGTTSALINESELDRALGDLAEQMMIDLYQSLVDRF